MTEGQWDSPQEVTELSPGSFPELTNMLLLFAAGSSGGFRGGQGGPGGGGNGFGAVLKGGPAGGEEIFWPVGQKFWAMGEMKTYIRHWRGEWGEGKCHKDKIHLTTEN